MKKCSKETCVIGLFLVYSPTLLSTTQSFQILGTPLLRRCEFSNRIRRKNDLVHSCAANLATKCQHTKRSQNYSTLLHVSTLPTAIAPVSNPSLGSIVISVTMLSIVALVHEAGHFLAARSLGIAVDEFSVGFGPKIAGFCYGTSHHDERNKETQAAKEGIDFSYRLIPFGGYVRFPENYDEVLMKLLEYEAGVERKERRRTIWEKMLRKINREKKIEEKMKVISLLISDFLDDKIRRDRNGKSKMILSDTHEPKRTAQHPNKVMTKSAPFHDKYTKNISSDIIYNEDPNLLQNRHWAERIFVLAAGVVLNVVLAFACYFGEVTVGNGLLQTIFEPGAVVSKVTPFQSRHLKGLIDEGDIIVGVNGKKMILPDASSIVDSHSEIQKVISTIQKTPPGQSLELSIIHGNHDQNDPIDVTVETKKVTDMSGEYTGLSSIGAVLAPNYIRTDTVYAASVVDAFVKASDAVVQNIKDTSKSLYLFVRSLINDSNAPFNQGISGPVGIILMGSEAFSSHGMSALREFLASISVNVAIMNSLPLLPFDGGQILFVVAEAATGNRIDPRLQEKVENFGSLLLLLVLLGTLVGDISSIPYL